MTDQPRRRARFRVLGGPSPDSQPPVADEVVATAEEGLEPRSGPAKRVIIIGGGIAGLVAAFELRRQGHEPLVLEAQNRVGGRVHTLRDFAPGLYAEAGAMRIPRVHDLTLAYCELFGLQLRPFVMGNPKALVHIGGQRMTVAEADADPDRLPFDLADHEQGQTWTRAVERGHAASSARSTSRAARSRSTICSASTTSTRSASSCACAASPRARSSSTAS